MTTRPLSSLASSSAGHGHAALLICVGLLAAASVSASLVFACAAPFAAFATLAVIVLPVRQALIAVATSWLVNQAIGFGLLGYPHTADSAAWGLVIGVAAAVAVFAAAGTRRYGTRFHIAARYPLMLVASYAAYELALLAATPALGGTDAFALDIVGNLAFVNAIWTVGLMLAYEILRQLVGADSYGLFRTQAQR